MVLIEGTDLMISNGWPLGLGNMSYRIRAVELSAQQAVAPPQTHTSRIPRSFSFSSFSSSNLDTESTASFFWDRSVSLGRLIGIKAANKEKLIVDERSPAPFEGVSKSHENSRGICVPLLHCVIGRMTRSGRH
ncbi:uncharacterized protein [Primulina eburnea]|uniref:uncharacterized protein n=1 Tax=Primulina eburnea TaxID=1245227 RepID=UPI003C6CC29D